MFLNTDTEGAAGHTGFVKILETYPQLEIPGKHITCVSFISEPGVYMYVFGKIKTVYLIYTN